MFPHAANLPRKAAGTGIRINGARGCSKDAVLDWIYKLAAGMVARFGLDREILDTAPSRFERILG